MKGEQMKPKAEVTHDVHNDVHRFSLTLQTHEYLNTQGAVEIIKNACEKVACALADEFIAKHFDEIMAKMKVEAIANMSIAHAGAKINETLNKKLPDRINTIRETEVYQRGIFGGMKRIK